MTQVLLNMLKRFCVFPSILQFALVFRESAFYRRTSYIFSYYLIFSHSQLKGKVRRELNLLFLSEFHLVPCIANFIRKILYKLRESALSGTPLPQGIQLKKICSHYLKNFLNSRALTKRPQEIIVKIVNSTFTMHILPRQNPSYLFSNTICKSILKVNNMVSKGRIAFPLESPSLPCYYR